MVPRALMPIDYVLVCAQQYDQTLPEVPGHLSQHNIFFHNAPQFSGEWHFWLQDKKESVLADWRIENPSMTLYVITLPGSLLLWKTRVLIDKFMAGLKAR